MRRLRRAGNVPGNSPHTGDQFARKRHHDLLGMLAASQASSRPFAQPDRRLPTAVLAGFGQWCPPPLGMAPALRRLAARPRAFHRGPAGVTMPGLGDAPLGAPWAPGICRGRRAQIAHPRFGVGKARAVAEFGAGRDRHGALDTPQRPEGVAHWGEAPGGDPLLEVLLQALAASGVLGARPPVLLGDELWDGRRPHGCRAPSARRGAPSGLARLADGLAQAEGSEAVLRGCEVTEAILAGAAQIASGFGLDPGDVDGGAVARTQRPGQWAGLAAGGVDPAPGCLRNSRGRDHPPVMPRLRQIAVQPRAARPGFVAQHEVFGLRVQLSKQFVAVTLAGAERPPGEDLRVMVLGHGGDRAGLLMGVQADLKRARLGHG